VADRGGPVTLPNFLIVGAQKGGTSSLAHCLREHPDVFLPTGEPHFFDADERYAQGVGWYEGLFAGHGGERAVGEKTPDYGHTERAPERIAATVPGVRLVWILRNPTERAHSHYWFRAAKGMERHSFARRVGVLPDGSIRGSGLEWIAWGLYATQVRRYLEFFPLEDMLFLTYEDYTRDPLKVLARVCEFLEVDPAYPFTRVGEQRNVTHSPRSLTVQAAGRMLVRRGWKRAGQAIMRANAGRGGYPPMGPDVRAALDRFYAPHNRDLAELTGLDITPWEIPA